MGTNIGPMLQSQKLTEKETPRWKWEDVIEACSKIPRNTLYSR